MLRGLTLAVVGSVLLLAVADAAVVSSMVSPPHPPPPYGRISIAPMHSVRVLRGGGRPATVALLADRNAWTKCVYAVL